MVAWLVASDPGRGRAGPGTLRGDLDVLQEHVTDVDTRVALAQAGWQGALERLDRLEAEGDGTPEAAALVQALRQDVGALRDAVRGELQVIDAQLADLRRRLDDPAPVTDAPGAPPTQEDEDRWATLARDPDPGARFSALSCLGRYRSERSVQVSTERLTDENVSVVWQALRNLAKFQERDAAIETSHLLTHDEEVLRAAAYEALLAMGAPKDTGFVATAAAQQRRAPAEALRRWAEGR